MAIAYYEETIRENGAQPPPAALKRGVKKKRGVKEQKSVVKKEKNEFEKNGVPHPSRSL